MYNAGAVVPPPPSHRDEVRRVTRARVAGVVLLVVAAASIVLGGIGALAGHGIARLLAGLAAVAILIVVVTFARHRRAILIVLFVAGIIRDLAAAYLPENVNAWGRRWASVLGTVGVVAATLGLAMGSVFGLLALS
jgi:hypothetical protein